MGYYLKQITPFLFLAILVSLGHVCTIFAAKSEAAVGRRVCMRGFEAFHTHTHFPNCTNISHMSHTFHTLPTYFTNSTRRFGMIPCLFPCSTLLACLESPEYFEWSSSCLEASEDETRFPFTCLDWFIKVTFFSLFWALFFSSFFCRVFIDLSSIFGPPVGYFSMKKCAVFSTIF